MYFLLEMGIFHCYVSLPEGREYLPTLHFPLFTWPLLTFHVGKELPYIRRIWDLKKNLTIHTSGFTLRMSPSFEVFLGWD